MEPCWRVGPYADGALFCAARCSGFVTGIHTHCFLIWSRAIVSRSSQTVRYGPKKERKEMDQFLETTLAPARYRVGLYLLIRALQQTPSNTHAAHGRPFATARSGVGQGLGHGQDHGVRSGCGRPAEARHTDHLFGQIWKSTRKRHVFSPSVSAHRSIAKSILRRCWLKGL